MESAEERYLAGHSSLRNEALEWLVRQTNLRTNYPQMLSGPVQGELLKILVEISSARNVLEIGTFTGYSSICMALGLPPGGSIDTYEINDELEDLIREAFQRAGVQDKVRLHIGDFLAEDLSSRFWDLVYIDANKREYPAYFDALIDHIRPGGLILADDTLWSGRVYATPVPTDPQTEALVRFNEKVASDTRVESLVLGLRHGLTIIRKL